MKLIGIIKFVFRVLKQLATFKCDNTVEAINNFECLVEPWVLD